ncbi:MAG TPA: hypothetical protein VNF47_09990 [Streptosporangiaceae bacterium]|nr:hypothetical protein [Streptosporangiaceae bacterium]
MSDAVSSAVTVGTRICFDGGLWEVAEMTATGVVLRDALGGLRQAGLSHLLASPGTRLLDGAGLAAVSAPGTSALALAETEELRRMAGHVREVLTGYQHGGEALALPGEPRPEYAPGTPKLDRCGAKAAELGVSVMTVRRMIWRFEADGPEGLIDQRRQRRRNPLAGTDARWLDMARRVLAEHTEASKPTQDLILAEIAARLNAEHGDGTVPAPKLTRGRALLREISKGTSAFGGTKAKREIAGRPAAPYGRLRAMRGGPAQPGLDGHDLVVDGLVVRVVGEGCLKGAQGLVRVGGIEQSGDAGQRVQRAAAGWLGVALGPVPGSSLADRPVVEGGGLPQRGELGAWSGGGAGLSEGGVEAPQVLSLCRARRSLFTSVDRG